MDIQVGQELTAALTHGGGEPADPRWQWQRSTADGLWVDVHGAHQAQYTPTKQDAGRRLRAIVTYVDPGGEVGVAGAVTPALPGEPSMAPAALYDANADGRIDIDEAFAAIRDYYNEVLELGGVMSAYAPPSPPPHHERVKATSTMARTTDIRTQSLLDMRMFALLHVGPASAAHSERRAEIRPVTSWSVSSRPGALPAWRPSRGGRIRLPGRADRRERRRGGGPCTAFCAPGPGPPGTARRSAASGSGHGGPGRTAGMHGPRGQRS